MKYTKVLVSLVAAFALAIFLIGSVSAFGSITSVEVNGVEGKGATNSISVGDGEYLAVRAIFIATSNASDVRVKAWVSGEQSYSVSSDRFDVVSGKVYSKLLSVRIPTDLAPTKDLKLIVSIENPEKGPVSQEIVSLLAQREAYNIEILDVSTDSSTSAGGNLALDIVLKNRGGHFAEDTFVTARIPALGIERRAYFGDLSAVDQANPDKEDAVERRMYLSIPSNAPAGVYLVEIEAYNSDSDAVVTKKVAIGNAGGSTEVVSAVQSATFAPGQKGTYSLTLVNSGNNVRVYELVFETASGLSVSSEESVVAVPAGSSRTVKFDATAEKAGKYSFAVNVHSAGQLVKRQEFTANVEGSKVGGSATVLLTVVLAIIFLVLLVVLIVLLTRKPQKSEEFGESYY